MDMDTEEFLKVHIGQFLETINDAEVLAVRHHAPRETVGNLGRERRRHRIGGRVAGAGGVSLAGVGGQCLRRGDLRRRIGETLGVHLVLVDRAPAVEQSAARLEGGVERGTRGAEDRRGLVGHARI